MSAPTRDLSNVEFDQWIICPKCQNAMVGEVGEECFLCHVPCVATPLYPEYADTEAENITAGVQRARKLQANDETNDDPAAICAEFGIEYSDEDKEMLDEFGL